MTVKRNSLAPKKVEDLILIKENKAKILKFKDHGNYHLQRNDGNPFGNISVETVIQNLVTEEERLEELQGSDIFVPEESEEEVFFFVNALDDSDDESSEAEDDEDIMELGPMNYVGFLVYLVKLYFFY